MSNVIPIVSSSPPPLDGDDGWDDDDGDFGNFASAPSLTPSPNQDAGDNDQIESDEFPVDWSNSDNTFHGSENPLADLSQHKAKIVSLNGVIECHSESVGSFANSNDFSTENTSHNKQNTDSDNFDFPADFDSHLAKQDSNSNQNMFGESSIPCHAEEDGADSSFSPANTNSNETREKSFLSENDVVASNNLSSLSKENIQFSSEEEKCGDTADHAVDEISKPDTNTVVSTSAEIEQPTHTDLHNENDDWGNFDDALNVDNFGAFEDEGSNPQFDHFDKDPSKTPVKELGDSIQGEDFAQFTETSISQMSESEIVDCDKNEVNLQISSAKNDDNETQICDSSSSYVGVDDMGASVNTNKAEELNDSQITDASCIQLTPREIPAEIDENISENDKDITNKISTGHSVDGLGSVEISESNRESNQSKDISEHSCDSTDITSMSKVDCHTHSGDDSDFENFSGNNTDVVACLGEKETSCIVESDNNVNLENKHDCDVSLNCNESVEDSERVNEGVVTVDTDNNDDECGDYGNVNIDNTENDLNEHVSPITFRTSICEEDGDGSLNPPPLDEEEEDDFGDYGGFDSIQSVSANVKNDQELQNESSIGVTTSHDGEDFGDFGSTEFAETVANDDGEFGSFNSEKKDTFKSSANEGDDFGDFDSGLKDTSEGFAAEESDDFGDFGESSGAHDAGWADFGGSSSTADSTSFSQDTVQVQPSVLSDAADKNKSKIVLVVEKCFPALQAAEHDDISSSFSKSESESPDGSKEEAGDSPGEITPLDVVVELGLDKPEEARVQTWSVVQHPAKKDPHVRIWNQMKDVDASHALGYAWPTSHCSSEVFCTLHIDTQNILFTQKKQAVPFFASGLGILEPTRGGNTPSDAKKDKATPLAAKGAPLQPTLLDMSAQNKPTTPPTNAQDIPPVDFDWSVSGLTNPLTAHTLDLDFLVVQGGDSSEKTSDEWDWVFKADADSGSIVSSLQPLEEMLKKSTPTAKLAPREVLSAEARKILAKLPNLSFMQSKVLMFPVKQ